MDVVEAIPLVDSPLVEVSGWDENEIFFVENSPLAGDDSVGKYITLSHMIAERAIIFVRALQPSTLHRASPVAYEVEFVGCSPEGHHQFRLNPVQPRYAHDRNRIN